MDTPKITITEQRTTLINGEPWEHTVEHQFTKFNKDGSLSKKDWGYPWARDNGRIEEVELLYAEWKLKNPSEPKGGSKFITQIDDIWTSEDLISYITHQTALAKADKKNGGVKNFQNIKEAVEWFDEVQK